VRSHRSYSLRAFTLVELMVVVLIISLLTMLAVPAFARMRQRTKTAAIINDFRVFAAAFDAYAHEHGNWPAESAAGEMPAGMATRLDASAWGRVTPMGGKYNWESDQMHFGIRYRAAISIAPATGAPLAFDVNQLISLEQTLDRNLDWLAGNFRLGTGMVPLFVIQQ
jgi:prepilin-type N-terminal cleavage/methylation domain-containing protein